MNWQYLSLLWNDQPITERDKLIADLRVVENNLESERDSLIKEVDELNSKLDKYVPSGQEKYWNNKRPKKNTYYNAREESFDVRYFFNQYDGLLPEFKGTNDEIANEALKYVHKKIKYTSDSGEWWQFAYETMHRKKGDCEDGAILMANIMLKSGVPYWRIRLNAGFVQGGGHAYVTYFREEDSKWYVLDWCYWYDESVDFKKKWDDAKKYFGIWFSWNEKYTFNDDNESRDYFEVKT